VLVFELCGYYRLVHQGLGLLYQIWGQLTDFIYARYVAGSEHFGYCPKTGELYIHQVKPGEILVEACSNADVQIACQMDV